MCGIVGYVGAREAAPILMDGLRRLEYRGYDSAGIAVLGAGDRLQLRKREGKLGMLAAELAADGSPRGGVGLGHTRWATHGPPTTANAHPHHDEQERIALVHNGIIENHARLREGLLARGHRFSSETDTEVLAHLIEEGLDRLAAEADAGERLAAAVRWALGQVEGAYGLAVLAADCPGVLVAARQFSPMVLGLGTGESFLASDIPAILSQTRRFLLLEDGDVALLRPAGVSVTDLAGRSVARATLAVDWDAAAAEKGGYAHFVRKEIDEQPEALADTLRGRLLGSGLVLPELEALDLAAVERVCLVACGSSAYAAMLGKLWLERWARLPAEVAIASELRYGDAVLGPDCLVVLVSQSGETADTLAALRLARAAGAPTLAVTNVVGSSLARGAAATLLLRVGPEVGVVATKTFTGQLAVLALVAIALGRRRGALDAAAEAALLDGLRQVPEAMAQALAVEPQVAELAAKIAAARSMFFIGRQFNHPIAMEAALKLKEISYIHAEGYPAGELKHGPLALLDENLPVLAFATAAATYPKLLSSIEEVRARGARVYAVATAGDEAIGRLAEAVIHVPAVAEEWSPFVNVVPAQLLAYHAALALGRDVDQPRNLAKSVTVE
ncbi:MAG: glutamine--fructose-6-phosphate transaminase (isomerizing) [Ardenticatenia bacterium]|nr:glutamine--fructose-6-phosphate transaminase (isomerizing) [Ardenticatenia bacterium]